MTNNEAISYLIEMYSYCATKYCSEEEKEDWNDKLVKIREAIAHVATNLNTSFITWRDYIYPENNGTSPTLPYGVVNCDSPSGIMRAQETH